LIGLKYQTETFGQQSVNVESTQLWGNREVNYQPINICRLKAEEEDEATQPSLSVGLSSH